MGRAAWPGWVRRTTLAEESAALAGLLAGKPFQFIDPAAPTSRLLRPAVPAIDAETSAPPAVTSRPRLLQRGATRTATNSAVAVIFWRSNGSICEKFPRTQYFLVIHGRTGICPSLIIVNSELLIDLNQPVTNHIAQKLVRKG